jgi:hypothetical protein
MRCLHSLAQITFYSGILRAKTKRTPIFKLPYLGIMIRFGNPNHGEVAHRLHDRQNDRRATLHRE